MQPVEIKKDIFWVGFVDYDHRDFHGYSRSPDGSTYNAYLIKDEKNVLLDTVASGYEGTLLCRMAQVLEPEKVDYIICNHMELDHAGALEAIIERCKPEKIFVSQTGLKSMAGYFDCKDWPVQAVKSGDSINIGKRTIVFQETRMLHWPDSMVSYIPEDKLLVSNDIFGQNIASSARFVDEFGDDGEYVRRVKEYYFNIVLPYSPMVLKTLPVVEKLDIDMIAPDHGLIHRGEKDVRHILDMYRAMAEQKPQQRALIFYDTMWQSTETMAYAICSGLEENGVPTRLMSVKQNHHSAVMTELADCGAVYRRFSHAQQYRTAPHGGPAYLHERPAAPQPHRRRFRLLRLVGRRPQIPARAVGRHEHGDARRACEVQLASRPRGPQGLPPDGRDHCRDPQEKMSGVICPLP